MMQLDTLRALAGIMASELMDPEIKEKAKELMLKIIKGLDKMTDMENSMLSKESAKLNGIIS